MISEITELREKYDLRMKVERYVSDELGEHDAKFIREQIVLINKSPDKNSQELFLKKFMQSFAKKYCTDKNNVIIFRCTK